MSWATRPARKPGEYGTEHRALRARWSPRVATGEVPCWRCEKLIARGERWVLGHSDDRSTYKGPEHQACSDESGARLAGSRSWTARPKLQREAEAHPGVVAE